MLRAIILYCERNKNQLSFQSKGLAKDFLLSCKFLVISRLRLPTLSKHYFVCLTSTEGLKQNVLLVILCMCCLAIFMHGFTENQIGFPARHHMHEEHLP